MAGCFQTQRGCVGVKEEVCWQHRYTLMYKCMHTHTHNNPLSEQNNALVSGLAWAPWHPLSRILSSWPDWCQLSWLFLPNAWKKSVKRGPVEEIESVFRYSSKQRKQFFQSRNPKEATRTFQSKDISLCQSDLLHNNSYNSRLKCHYYMQRALKYLKRVWLADKL